MKWVASAFVLGAVLGICFTVLLRTPSDAPRKAQASPRSEINKSLAEGLLNSSRLMEEGRAQEAEATLKNLIERHPGSPEPYNNLAQLMASRGELEKSRELLEKALRTHEGYAAVYENLGVVYSEIARSSYGKALRLDLPPSTPQLKLLAVPVEAAAPSVIASSGDPSPRASESPAPVPPPSQPEPAAPAPPPAPPPPPAAPGGGAGARAGGKPTPKPAVKQEEIVRTLHAWAQAWSQQDVPTYLSFYGKDFRPDDGTERGAWEEQRRQRIQHPSWITVTLRNVAVTPNGTDAARVRLVQEYAADTFRDRTRKEFEMTRENGVWRILSERSLGSAR